MSDYLNRVLITGGTGSLGKALISKLIERNCDRICSYARCEVRAAQLQAEFGDYPGLKVMIGDVRDRHRLEECLPGVDTVIHAAALKRVDGSTTHSGEIHRTNVDGTANVIAAALACSVKRVILISSDKAVHPQNPYGASKLMAEYEILEADQRGRHQDCRFAVCRYGNVLGSRGSVVGLWRSLTARGLPPSLTDVRMTRFWITMPQAVAFVLACIERMRGGEIFLPILPAARLIQLAEAIAPHSIMPLTGLRAGGEKIHERLLTDEESSRARWQTLGWKDETPDTIQVGGEAGDLVPDGFAYCSADGPFGWLGVEEMRNVLKEVH